MAKTAMVRVVHGQRSTVLTVPDPGTGSIQFIVSAHTPEIAIAVHSIVYPATRAQLVAAAAASGADAHTLLAMNNLPDRPYANLLDVVSTAGL